MPGEIIELFGAVYSYTVKYRWTKVSTHTHTREQQGTICEIMTRRAKPPLSLESRQWHVVQTRVLTCQKSISFLDKLLSSLVSPLVHPPSPSPHFLCSRFLRTRKITSLFVHPHTGSLFSFTATIASSLMLSPGTVGTHSTSDRNFLERTSQTCLSKRLLLTSKSKYFYLEIASLIYNDGDQGLVFCQIVESEL